MDIQSLKSALSDSRSLHFLLPDGSQVPAHFHVTEIAKVTKNFMDCGGQMRYEEVVTMQLWSADDIDHRLEPAKLNKIIEMAQPALHIQDSHRVEVEYQGDSIVRYGLDRDGQGHFRLTTLQTDCLARDKCNIPASTAFVSLSSEISNTECTPGGGCC